MSDGISPGERRELRAAVRARLKVLRAEVDRRKDELVAEVEHDLALRYQAQDAAIAGAQAEVERVLADAERAVREIGARLREQHPELRVAAGRTRYSNGIVLQADDENRAQIRRAALAAVPNRVSDARLALDRQEADLLTALSAGALESESARGFLAGIPTVGELVPRVRVRELEQQLEREA